MLRRDDRKGVSKMIYVAIAAIIIGAWVMYNLKQSNNSFVEAIERDIANLAAADKLRTPANRADLPQCTAGRDWALTSQENNLAHAMQNAPQAVKVNTAYGILTMSGELYMRAELGQLEEVARELFEVTVKHGGKSARAQTPRGVIEFTRRPMGAEAIQDAIAKAYGDPPEAYTFDAAEPIDVTAEWIKK